MSIPGIIMLWLAFLIVMVLLLVIVVMVDKNRSELKHLDDLFHVHDPELANYHGAHGGHGHGHGHGRAYDSDSD